VDHSLVELTRYWRVWGEKRDGEQEVNTRWSVMAKILGIYFQAKVTTRRANDTCVAQSRMA
jgi:hypothetical protein